MRRFLSFAVSVVAVLSALSVSPVSAAVDTPRVMLSDYSPEAEQQIRLYFEGLEPYTEYSYGYIFAVGQTVNESVETLDSIDELGTFTTNAIGKKEIEFYWGWSVSSEPSMFSGVLPSYIYVNDLGVEPVELSDPIAISRQVIPGHLSGLSDVTVDGPAFAGDVIESNSTIVVNVTDINQDYDWFTAWSWSGEDNYLDIWETLYSSNWLNPVIFDYDEFSYWQEDLLIQTSDFEMDRVLLIFTSAYSSYGGWMMLDADGNELWVDDPHEYAHVADQVKPYTWTEGYYGSEDTFFDIRVYTPKKCFANGNDLVFLSPGTCSWKIYDAQSSYVYSDSTEITNSAPAINTFPLEVLHLKFAKGRSSLTSKMLSKIEDFASYQYSLNYFVAGHAYEEGTAKTMKALAKARTVAVKNYLRIDADSVLANTTMSNSSPFGNAASSRRVDVIAIPYDEWTDLW